MKLVDLVLRRTPTEAFPPGVTKKEREIHREKSKLITCVFSLLHGNDLFNYEDSIDIVMTAACKAAAQYNIPRDTLDKLYIKCANEFYQGNTKSNK